MDCERPVLAKSANFARRRTCGVLLKSGNSHQDEVRPGERRDVSPPVRRLCRNSLKQNALGERRDVSPPVCRVYWNSLTRSALGERRDVSPPVRRVYWNSLTRSELGERRDVSPPVRRLCRNSLKQHALGERRDVSPPVRRVRRIRLVGIVTPVSSGQIRRDGFVAKGVQNRRANAAPLASTVPNNRALIWRCGTCRSPSSLLSRPLSWQP
jgi:hypothetical protein